MILTALITDLSRQDRLDSVLPLSHSLRPRSDSHSITHILLELPGEMGNYYHQSDLIEIRQQVSGNGKQAVC